MHTGSVFETGTCILMLLMRRHSGGLERDGMGGGLEASGEGRGTAASGEHLRLNPTLRYVVTIIIDTLNFVGGGIFVNIKVFLNKTI